MPGDPDTFFSRSYTDARLRFRRAATDAGARLESLALAGETGVAGEALFTDVAVLGPGDAPVAALLVSGTHGVEGYFGSAALCQLLSGLAEAPPTNMRLVLIHGLNPYGMSHARRVTEENVDLNRNFIDHTAPLPENPAYGELADAVIPARFTEEALSEANHRLRAFIATHGQPAFQAAVTAGQYSHPEGICYGGTRPAWSNRTFREILRRHLSGRQRVLFIDMHTGLGERGSVQLIVEEADTSPMFHRVRTIWGDLAAASLSGDSLSPPLHGPIEWAVEQELAGSEVTSVCLEVGTVSVTETFLALRADNWLYARGEVDSAEGKRIKDMMWDAFAPDDRAWQRMVLDHADGIITRGLLALAG